MKKEPTPDIIPPEESNTAALQQENEKLSQQVKHLVKTESKLYQYQEELDAQLNEYKSLYELNKKLNSTSKICDIFEHAIEYVIQNLGYERCVLFHRLKKSDDFHVCAIDGYYDTQKKNQVASLTIKQNAPLLAPLLAGREYLICRPDSEEDELCHYREKLLMAEYFLYPLGTHLQPGALLAFGNTAEKAEFYRRVGDNQGALFSIGNFTEAITSSLGNCIFYNKLKQALKLEKSAKKAFRESEHNYRQLSEALEIRVKQTVDELRQKDQLLIIQGRQAVMGEMISNIAHQWRQPLNILGLLAQDLQLTREMGKLTQKFINENANKTMEIIQQMSKTIDDFSYFFRPGPENKKIKFRICDKIEKTISLLKGSLEFHNIEVKVEAASNPVIDGYPDEISQVFLNIMINARDALVKLQVHNPFIRIRVSEEGDKAIVCISDNAGGIPEEIIDRIFDPYFSTKGPEQGTGIGLFMCKTIIEKNMNGTLSVRNSGFGAEFRIEILRAPNSSTG